MQFQPDLRLILAIYLGLVLFGMAYNQAVAICERKGFLEGFTWLSVVVGVFVTLVFLALISWQWSLVALGGFACSGLPMAAGGIWRYIEARKRGQEHDRQAAGLAERGEGGAGPGGGGGGEGDPIAEAVSVRGAKFHRD